MHSILATTALASAAVVGASKPYSLSEQCLFPSLAFFNGLSCDLSGQDLPSVDSIPRSSVDSLPPLHSTENATSTQQPQAFADPWDLPPICTQPLEKIDDVLCIYTSTTFANGRGISILTRPDLAAHLAQTPAFQSSTSHDDLSSDEDVPWEAADLPGRGVGLLATRNLVLGDLITNYTPVFIAIRTVGELISAPDLEVLFRRALDRLPEASRLAFMALATSFNMEEYRAQDIVATNSFDLHVNGESHLAVYPETSRLNHDCGPNAVYHIDPQTLHHKAFATRPIPPGEELTISYSYPLTKTPLRASNLHQTFHFTCTCARCRHPATDTHLDTLAALEDELEGHPTRALAQAIVELYERAGLHSMLARPYALAAYAFAAKGEGESAREYGRMAVRVGALKAGMGNGEVRALRDLLGDLGGEEGEG